MLTAELLVPPRDRRPDAKSADGPWTVRSGRIERTWPWTGRGLATVSLRDAETGQEWVAPSDRPSDWDFGDLGEGHLVGVRSYEDDDGHFTSPHHVWEAEIHYRSLHLKYVVWAYPDAPGLRTQLWLKLPPDASAANALLGAGVSESLALEPGPISVTAFGYMAGYKSDMTHSILTEEDLPPDSSNAVASGLRIEAGKGGILMVKESHKHTQMDLGDLETGSFVRSGNRIDVTGLGMRPGDLKSDEYRFAWANWTIVYAGKGVDAQLALKRFDRARYPVNSSRDMVLMSNTWGTEDPIPECKYKAREENVLVEIEAAADLGLEMVQIDDGWQDDNWRPAARSEVKEPLELRDGQVIDSAYAVYPHGFANVRVAAEAAGIKLGLWNEWGAPLESLIANYEEGGFRAFKLDFAILDKKDDLDRLYFKARKLIEYSGFSARVNWDETALPPRMGFYFGRDCGNIYIANRKAFTVREKAKYRPHQTLRDIWLLARYMNLNQLQIAYQNKDLAPPGDAPPELVGYSHAYNLAITLMGSPILFTEVQYIGSEARAELRPLIALFKEHRESLARGYVFALGEKPDGSRWTGFQNHDPEANAGYLIIFRELQNSRPSARLALHFVEPGQTIEVMDLLTGEKSRQVVDNDQGVEFAIDPAPGFRFLRYELVLS